MLPLLVISVEKKEEKKVLLLPFLNVEIPISQLQKYSLENKITKDIGLRLCDFVSEMVKNL